VTGVQTCALPISAGAVLAANAAVALSKVLQMAGGAVYDMAGNATEINRAKLLRTQEIVEGASGGVVVWFQWQHEADRLVRAFGPAAVRASSVAGLAAWLAGDVRVLVAHPDQAGVGVDLSPGGHTAVWFSLPWSAAAYAQANARMRHPDQSAGRVLVHRLLAGTAGERAVLDALAGKEALQRALMTELGLG
jgi:hypothetical protein